MNSIQHLRGPDASGISGVTGEGFCCTLGHTRLAIIDRDGGVQPMTDPESGVCIVFNGEIYNHTQLRTELEGCGRTFRTRSDTEVLLSGYLVWGIQGLLERIDGMFAFAVADPVNGTLILARDPAGQKPLYYTKKAGQPLFAFASTLEALSSLPWFERETDQDALELFLCLRVIPAPHTIYRQARRLPPGCFLIHNGSTQEIKEYWSPFTIPLRQDDLPEHGLLHRYRTLLSSSLQETLVADVPVSLLLSSGVDSSSLASELSRLPERASVSAYTVGFQNKDYDESEAAVAIAGRLHLTHKVLNYDDRSFRSQLDELASMSDEPFGDPGILPALQLCRSVAAAETVAISGDGADELFGGYHTFRALRYWPAVNRFPGLSRRLCDCALQSLRPSGGPHSLAMKIERMSHGLGHPDAMAFARWLCIFSPDETASLLGKQNSDVFSAFVSGALSGLPHEDPVSMMCRIYFRLFLPGVLEKMDRASMRHSLEIRAPFLQRRMLEFGLSLPPHFKLRHGTTKYIMRRSLEDHVPKTLTAGKKGFLPPLAAFFADREDSRTSAMLTDACDGFGLERRPVLTMLDEHRQMQRDHSDRLWLIYQLALFRRKTAGSK